MKSYVTVEEKRLIAVHAVLADAVKPLHGIVPVLRPSKAKRPSPPRNLFPYKPSAHLPLAGHDLVNQRTLVVGKPLDQRAPLRKIGVNGGALFFEKSGDFTLLVCCQVT